LDTVERLLIFKQNLISNRTFGVNFKAALNITQVFGKGVIEHKLPGGTIVNISSIVRLLENFINVAKFSGILKV